MKVVVLFESRTGNTREAARWIGGAAQAKGAEVYVRSVREPDLDELGSADLAFIGTWVDGLVLVGHRPGGARHLKRHLPMLWDIPVAAFTTHAVNPGKAATKLGWLLAGMGASVVQAQSFHRKRLPDGIAEFVDAAMAAADGTVMPAAEAGTSDESAGAAEPANATAATDGTVIEAEVAATGEPASDDTASQAS
jgi:hypothetical protein